MVLPKPMQTLLADNLAALDQARALLRSLTPEQYSQPIPVCFNSSIGGHVRHALDHYVSFNAGLDTARIDYEARARDTRLERERDYALARLDQVIAQLRASALVESPVLVRLENQDDSWADSTLRRELQFLLSHTIHHWALVSVCAASQGIKTPDDFGVAPSTIRYRAAATTSAHAAPTR